MAESIEIRGLTKTFTVDGQPVEVLKDLNLTIAAQEITVILGRSGCGKTTLLRLIAGLDQDYSGTISTPAGNRTAFVFQEPRLMPWLTVRKNISFGLNRKEISSDAIDALIHLTGLDGFADAYPRQLSGGMSQRTALARALAVHPQFILMDEPFAALDHFTREKMQQALKDIHQSSRCGVLFVTHSIDEALSIGHRIVVLENKKVKKVYPLNGCLHSFCSEEQRQTLKAEILSSIHQ